MKLVSWIREAHGKSGDTVFRKEKEEIPKGAES